MVKKCIKMMINLVNKIRFYIKLKQMDNWWYMTGGNCFGLFPPSFYYTHTEEEIKRITDETLEGLRLMIDQLDDDDQP